MKNWYAIYTSSRTEKKVSERLSNRGIEVYCPFRKELRIWSDRKKKVEVPVFPSYVFVKVDELGRLKVLETPGVVNFVFWLGKPAIIRESELNAIRSFLNEHETANSRSIEIKLGQEVKIAVGQFQNRDGIVTEIRNTSVVLRLEGLGFELYAEVQKNQVEKVK